MTGCAQFEFPSRKVTVNLAPADRPKESGRFDLPIALGILAATGQLPAAALAGYEFAGELALTGDLRPIRGALAMTLKAHRDGRAFVLPEASARSRRNRRPQPPSSLLGRPGEDDEEVEFLEEQIAYALRPGYSALREPISVN